MIRQSLRRLHGSAVIAKDLRGQRSIPFLQRERLEALRDRRIRHIISYAARSVPYYRELFAREGIDPSRIKGATDLDRLPLLDKKLVRAQPHLFIAETREAQDALTFHSSGTTGTPTEVCHDQRSLLANIAFGEREREPVIRGCSSFRPKELYVGYDSSTFKKVVAFYEQSVLFPVRPQRKFVSLLEPIERIAAVANEERPDILVGYGGWIDLFFKTVLARNIHLHLPKMIMYIGEALPPGGREFIEKNFCIPVMSRYNSVEAFKIGFFCEQRTGFHLHEDICHVRMVGPDGLTVEAGKQGELVISNLVNHASVLLNYPTGDVASISQNNCPCGRTFRLLSELEGRVEDILPLADGRFIHPRAIWHVLKHNKDILQYQLTQWELQRFELKLVASDRPAFERAITHALPELQRLLGTDALVEASHLTEFERTTGWKFRAVVSLCERRNHNRLLPEHEDCLN